MPQAASFVQLPTEYFCQVLGRWRKYSACLYRDPGDTLDEAEENMLQLYCDELHLTDNLELLDLGCGWGSFTLYAVRNMGIRGSLCCATLQDLLGLVL